VSSLNSKNWTVCELGDLCSTITDGTHLPPPFTEHGVPFLFVRNIVRGVIDFDVEKYISQRTYDELTKKHRAERGDLLFSAVGSFGVAVVVRTDEPFAFQRHIAHIKPDATRVDADFLACFLNSPQGRAQSEAVAMGGAQRTVTLTDLRRFKIPLPTLEEQRRVSAKLQESLAVVGSAKRAVEDRLAAAESLSAAYLREVFEGPEATKWGTRPLGDMVQGNGQYGTSQRSNREGCGLPVLGMPHIHQGRIRWQNVSFADLSPEDLDKYRLEVGDVLFNRTNSAELVGKTAVFDGAREAVFASYLIRYRALEDIADPRFICTYINSRPGRIYIERHMARAVGQVNINASTMHRMPIPCPPIVEQRRLMDQLSERLGAVELLTAKSREELSAIDAIPAAVLRVAFNGDT
jgi:type I restriction enzyme, S subunit